MSFVTPSLQFFNEDPVQHNGFDEDEEDEVSTSLSTDGKSTAKRPKRKRTSKQNSNSTEGPPDFRKSKGKQKIEIEFMHDKNRRYSTFSKRKTGLMKKAYQLAKLTGAEVLLLVASETNHVYTFATEKLRTIIDSENGISLIQTCLLSGSNQPPASSTDQLADAAASSMKSDDPSVVLTCAPATSCGSSSLVPVSEYSQYQIVNTEFQDAAPDTKVLIKPAEGPPALQRCPVSVDTDASYTTQCDYKPANIINISQSNVDSQLVLKPSQQQSTVPVSNAPLTPSIEFLIDILNNKRALPSESGESQLGDLGDMQSPGIPQELLREYLKNEMRKDDSVFTSATPNPSLLSASFLNTPSVSISLSSNHTATSSSMTSSQAAQEFNKAGHLPVTNQRGSTLVFFPPDEQIDSGNYKIIPATLSTSQVVTDTGQLLVTTSSGNAATNVTLCIDSAASAANGSFQLPCKKALFFANDDSFHPSSDVETNPNSVFK